MKFRKWVLNYVKILNSKFYHNSYLHHAKEFKYFKMCLFQFIWIHFKQTLSKEGYKISLYIFSNVCPCIMFKQIFVIWIFSTILFSLALPCKFHQDLKIILFFSASQFLFNSFQHSWKEFNDIGLSLCLSACRLIVLLLWLIYRIAV